MRLNIRPFDSILSKMYRSIKRYSILLSFLLVFSTCAKNEEVTSMVIKGETIDLAQYKLLKTINKSYFGMELLKIPNGFQIMGSYNGKVRVMKTYRGPNIAYAYDLDSLNGVITYSDSMLNGEAISANGSRLKFVNFK